MYTCDYTCYMLLHTYSLHTKKNKVILNSDTVSKVLLWLLVFIKIFIKKWYMYIFMKVFFKTNLFIWLSHFQTQQLKSYLWFIFSIFDSSIIQNNLNYQYRGSTPIYPLACHIIIGGGYSVTCSAYLKRMTPAPRVSPSPRGDQRAAGQWGSAYAPTSLWGCAPRSLLSSLPACGQHTNQENKILLCIFFKLL